MTYQLELSGYGVEIVVGTISKKTFNYFLSNNIDMQDFINGNVEIPKELKPFDNGAWFECDDIVHLHNLFFEEKNKLIIMNFISMKLLMRPIDLLVSHLKKVLFFLQKFMKKNLQ